MIGNFIELTDRYTQTKIRLRWDEIAWWHNDKEGHDYRIVGLKNGKQFHVINTIQGIDKASRTYTENCEERIRYLEAQIAKKAGE